MWEDEEKVNITYLPVKYEATKRIINEIPLILMEKHLTWVFWTVNKRNYQVF